MGDVNYKINLSDGGAIEKLRKLEEQAIKTERALDALNKKRKEEVVDKLAARQAMDAQKQHALDMKHASDLHFKRMRDADLETIRKERNQERLAERERRDEEKLAERKRRDQERLARENERNIEKAKTQQMIALELIGRKFNSFANFGFSMLRRGISYGRNIGTDLLDRGGELMKNEADLKTILGEGSGSKVFEQTRQFVRESPFGTEIYDMVKKLSPAFKNRPEAIIPKIKQLADITGADPDMLGRVVEAYATGANTGEARKKLFNTFAAAGEGMIQALSKNLGISRAAVLKKGRAGEIGMADVDKVLAQETGPGGTFYQRLKRVEETPYGRREELKGTFEDIKADIGKKIMESSGFKKFLDALANMFKDEAAIDKIARFGGKVFEKLGEYVEKADKFIRGGGLDKILSSIEYAINHIKEILLILGTAKMVGLATSFVNLLNLFNMSGIVGGAGSTIVGAESAGLLASTSLGPIAAGIALLAGAFYTHPELGEDLSKLGQSFKSFFGNLYETLKPFVNMALDSIAKDLQLIFSLISKSLNNIANGYDMKVIKTAMEWYGKWNDFTKNNREVVGDFIETTVSKFLPNPPGSPMPVTSNGFNPYDPLGLLKLGGKVLGPVDPNRPQPTTTTGTPKEFKTDETKVTGTKALNIYINMEALVKGFNVTAQGVIGTSNSDVGNKVKDVIVQALNEALVEAEGVAAARNR